MQSIDWVVSNSMGISYPAIISFTLGILPISLPTLSEQEEIVGYLDERCDKIDKMAKAIGRKVELLGQLKRSLIEEVVTGKRKVVD